MEKRVKLHHCIKMGFCEEGMILFGKKHGLSFQKLITEGLLLSELKGIDDSRAQAIIKLIESET